MSKKTIGLKSKKFIGALHNPTLHAYWAY